MTVVESVAEDGSLPESLGRLGNAISALIDPKPQTVEDRIIWVDSLYTQLVEALPGEQGSGQGVARSLPPVWLDAADLKCEIDTTVSVWLPAPVIDLLEGDTMPLTVLRLEQLEKKAWRPQDTRQIDQIAGIVESWAANIKNLLSPTPKWSLPAPCPSCNRTTVYRRDSGGEMVRQPALQIGVDGCTCLACKTVWPPERFVLLSKVLSMLPDNVDAA